MKSIVGGSLIIASMLLLSAALVPAQTREDVKEAPTQALKELDSIFQSQLDSLRLVGMSACIIKDGHIAWSGGYGLADLERRIPVTPNTLFHLGSTSKTVTVAALLHLWEQGKFALDDDINAYLPFKVRNPRYPNQAITFRMLLTHTSSISDVRPGSGTLTFLNENQDSKMPLEEVLQGFLVPGGKYYAETNYRDSAPGERYEYSNISFSLIGYMIERISGRSFTAYCSEYLFRPLLMKESTWRLSEVNQAHYAFQYARDAQTGRNDVKVLPYTWPGYMDGGLRSSANEYGNFLIMMANRGMFKGSQILKPATMDTLLAIQNLRDSPRGRTFPTIGHALLWILSRAKDHDIFQMNGFGTGFFTQVYFDPKSGIGGAFFITGEFSSFPAMGSFVVRTFDELFNATDRL
jgi:CubicO group peptidase (beta-lactamase class C family)